MARRRRGGPSVSSAAVAALPCSPRCSAVRRARRGSSRGAAGADRSPRRARCSPSTPAAVLAPRPARRSSPPSTPRRPRAATAPSSAPSSPTSPACRSRAWQYPIVGTIHDPRGAARARPRATARPALLLHVTLELRAARHRPAPERARPVPGLRRSGTGTPCVAGDDALAGRAALQLAAGRGDYGPLVARAARASLVLGPPGRPRAAAGARRATSTPRSPRSPRSGATGWAQRVAVMIPASPAEFARAQRHRRHAERLGRRGDRRHRPGHRPAAFGQRLVLNPTQLDRLTADRRGIVLRHEITHLAAAADTADITPRWLVEGFAEYVGNLRQRAAGARRRGGAARRGARRARCPRRCPPTTAFAATGAALARPTSSPGWPAG